MCKSASGGVYSLGTIPWGSAAIGGETRLSRRRSDADCRRRPRRRRRRRRREWPRRDDGWTDAAGAERDEGCCKLEQPQPPPHHHQPCRTREPSRSQSSSAKEANANRFSSFLRESGLSLSSALCACAPAGRALPPPDHYFHIIKPLQTSVFCPKFYYLLLRQRLGFHNERVSVSRRFHCYQICTCSPFIVTPSIHPSDISPSAQKNWRSSAFCC